MSDRRTKERERVWGHRPVILRFDSGHPRRNLEPAGSPLSDQATADLLSAFFQSVIQTDSMGVDPHPAVREPKRQPAWHLVEPDEAVSQPVRKPIEIAPAATAAESERMSDDTATATLEPPPKPRHRPFWRLQTPHLFLHVFSPERK